MRQNTLCGCGTHITLTVTDVTELTLKATPSVTSILRSISFLKTETVKWLTTDTAVDQLPKQKPSTAAIPISTQPKSLHHQQLNKPSNYTKQYIYKYTVKEPLNK